MDADEDVKANGKQLAVIIPVGCADEETGCDFSAILPEEEFSHCFKRYLQHPTLGSKETGTLFSAHNKATVAFLSCLLRKFQDDACHVVDCINYACDGVDATWSQFARMQQQFLRGVYDITKPQEKQKWNDLVKDRVESTLGRLLPDGITDRNTPVNVKEEGTLAFCVYYKDYILDSKKDFLPPIGSPSRAPKAILVVRIMNKVAATALVVIIPEGDEKLKFVEAEEALAKLEAAQESSSRPIRIEIIGKDKCDGISRSLEVFEEQLADYTLAAFKREVTMQFQQPGNGGIAQNVSTYRVHVASINGVTPDVLSTECACKCGEFEQGVADVALQQILEKAAVDLDGVEKAALTVLELHVFVQDCVVHIDERLMLLSPTSLQHEEAFPEQKETAQRLLNRVKWVLQSKFGRSLASFDSMDYFILVPTFSTLMEQTLARARAYLEPRTTVDGFRSKKKVAMCQLVRQKDSSGRKTSMVPPAFAAFKERIQENERTLFVLVLDESHWGANKGGAHDTIVNHEVLRMPNVVVLQVSATPYCNLTRDSRIPERYVTEFRGKDHMREIAEVDEGDGSEESLQPLFDTFHEEVNVVRWFTPGATRKRGFYFRLEDFLQTIPSKIRHDAVSRFDGSAEPAIKRPICSRLIRADEMLDARLPQSGWKRSAKVAAEYVWVVDFVFSMVYFAARWDRENRKLQDDGGAGLSYRGTWQTFESCMKDATQHIQSRRTSSQLGSVEACLEVARLELLKQIRELVRSDPSIKELKDQDGEMGDVDVKELSAADRDTLVAAFLRAKAADELDMWNADKERETYFTETDRIVFDLLTRTECDVDGGRISAGHMTVVRVSANDYGFLMRCIIMSVRNELFCPHREHVETTFAVIQDTGSSSLADSLEAEFKAITVQKAGGRGLTTLADVLRNNKKTLTYTDLEGVPCLLFLCKKGRMGDTFPRSCVCLDLRIRTSENLTTMVQELGRLSRHFHRFRPDPIPFNSGASSAALKTIERELPIAGSGPMYAVFAFKAESSAIPADRIVEFRGFARSVRAWSNECNCTLVAKGKPWLQTRGSRRARSKPEEFVLQAKHSVSLEGCRVVVFDSGKKNKALGEEGEGDKHLVYRTVIAHEPDSDVLQLDHAFPPEQDTKQRYSIFRDESCLEELCHPRQCPHGGVIKLVLDDLPYALVTKQVMTCLGTARDNADRYWREICDCIRMKTFDRFVRIAPTKGNQLVIDDTKNEVHDYRRRYFARGKAMAGDDDGDTTSVSVDYSYRGANGGQDPEWLHELRFQLSAECQIGKTGAYLHFLRLVQEELSQMPLPALPLPRDNDGFQTLHTTCQGVEGWVLPFWRDISRENQSWELFKTQGIRRGKYHPRVMLQRLELLLSVLVDELFFELPWKDKAAEFKRRLVSPPTFSSGSASMGEGVISTTLQLTLDECFTRWTCFDKSPIEIVPGQAMRFRITDEKNLRSLIDWDCPPSAIQAASLFASPTAQQSLIEPRDRCTHEKLIKVRKGTYELQKPLGDCSVVALSWNTLSQTEESSDGVNLSQSEHPYVARVMPRLGATAVGLQASELQLASTMCGVDVQTLFGTPDNWPRIYMRSGLARADIKLFQLNSEGKVEKAAPSAYCNEKVKSWVFTPSFDRHGTSTQLALFDRSSAFSCSEQSGPVTQLLLVRASEVESYYSYVGSDYLVVTLPENIFPAGVPNLDVALYTGGNMDTVFTPKSGGIGFVRLFGQIFAHLLGLKRVFFIDDNVQACYQLNLAEIFQRPQRQKQPLLPCTFSTVMIALERQFTEMEETEEQLRTVTDQDLSEPFSLEGLAVPACPPSASSGPRTPH